MSEIGTAVENGINTVCVVMNNGCWGAEKAYQRDFFGERYIGADVPNPPYDKLAELMARAGFRVDKAARARARPLRAALACGKPAIVDVMVDPERALQLPPRLVQASRRRREVARWSTRTTTSWSARARPGARSPRA